MKHIILIVLGMGISASVASLFLKKSTTEGLSIFKLLKNSNLYLGGGLYVSSAFLNLYLLKILPYSIVVPLGSLTYIWTLILSRFFLGESITKYKMIGSVLILIGIYFIVNF